MKLQLALEFIIIFSFTVVVLMLIFGMIGSQRVYISNQQVFLQLQLVAQNIVQQLDTAATAGNGYTSNIVLQNSFGMPLYNITISKSGTVVVYATVESSFVHTVAYSSARNVVSAPLLDVKTMRIENSGGEICVDTDCPGSESSKDSVQLNDLLFHVASFSNGSYISIPNTGVLNNLLNISMCGWVYSRTGATTAAQGLWAKRHKNGHAPMPYGMNFSTSGVSVYTSGGSGVQTFAYSMPKNAWVFLCGIIAKSASTALYVNGTPFGTSGTGGGVATGANALIIGSTYPGVEMFDGMMADLQFYSVPLTSTQVQAQYKEGIEGAPASGSLIAWWPFDGNANDYSNNGNSGTLSGVLFPLIAELIANVRGGAGASESILVGFTTTLGSLIKGLSEVHYSSAGSAETFLTGNGTSGYAHVEATAYSGNLLEESKLTGWWPLNMRQGSVAADLSGSGNSGILYNASWSSPAYAARFNGSEGIEIGNTMQLGSSAITASLWVYPSGGAGRESLLQYGSSNSVGLSISKDMNATFSIHIGGTAYSVNAIEPLAQRNWYQVTGTYNGTAMDIYVNGVLENKSAVSGALTQPTGSAWIGSAGASQFFYGNIADVQLYTSALGSNDVENIYRKGIAAVPLPWGIAGWWPLDYDSLDHSRWANNGSVYGNEGYSALNQQEDSNASDTLMAVFNGINSEVNITNSTVLQLKPDTLGMSIGAWLTFNELPQGSEALVYTYPAAPPSACGYGMNITASSFGASDTCGEGYKVSYAFQPNTLYNLFLTANPSGANVMETFYVNGVAIGRGLAPIWNTGGAWSNLYLGSTGRAEYFNGMLSNVQIYNTSLGPSAVSGLYKEGIASMPLDNSNLAGWWNLDGNASDLSNNFNTGSTENIIYAPVRASSFSLAGGIGNYGVTFGGSGNVFISGTTPLGIDTATASLWVYPSGGAGRESLLQYGSSNSVGFSIGQDMHATFSFKDIFNVVHTVSTAMPLRQQSWYMLTGTYNGVAMDIYVNGELSNRAAASGDILQPTGSAWIGSAEASQFFYGNIADVQLYNSALSSAEVSGLYTTGMPEYSSLAVPIH